MRYGTLFSGIGAPEQAIKDLGLDWECQFACEIDKWARAVYRLKHRYPAKGIFLDATKLDLHGVAHKGGIRRLTPKECERLQGFPDDFTARSKGDTGAYIKISDSQRYKMIGNSMTTKIVGLVIKRLHESVNRYSEVEYGSIS